MSTSKRSLGEGYKFAYRGLVKQKSKRPSGTDGLFICSHLYRFKTRTGKIYLAEVEEYKYHIFVLKYYLKGQQGKDYRYQYLTNDGDGFRILTTCCRIFLDILARDPLASGGFLGEPLPEETYERNKRYRVYRKVVETFFSDEDFAHDYVDGSSLYFLRSLRNPEPDLRLKAQDMFNEIYMMEQVSIPEYVNPSSTAEVG